MCLRKTRFTGTIYRSGSRVSQRRGRQPQMWGRQPIVLVNFLPKLHENEIWTQRGAPVPGIPPHLGSTNDLLQQLNS